MKIIGEKMKKNIYEILDEFKLAKTEREKRQILVDNATPDLIAFLQLAFDPRVKFIIEDIPAYKPSGLPPGMGYTNMGNAVSKAYLFIEGHPKRSPNLVGRKMENALINILESLESREADMYVLMLKKAVRIPQLTPKLLEKTFPGIFEIPIKA